MNRWDQLQTSLRLGAIGRREFLAAAAAMGIAGSLTSHALAQTPKRGGHLAMGISEGGTSDSFDPATWNSTYREVMGAQVHDNLVSADEHLAIRPSLAESWEFKTGAKVWVFKIRKGVTFHNGKTLTPADVVYSINHHRGKDSKSMAKAIVAGVDDITVTGPNEITIVLNSANIDLPYLLTDWRIVIVPEGSAFNGVGTGAFVLESFEPGIRLRTKRNVNDWRQDRGYVDTVETLAINDPTARLSALLSGAAHLIDAVPASSVNQLEKNGQVQIFKATGSFHGTMAMLADARPYENLDLRLALKYAIDREAVLKTVFHGYGVLANDQPIPPSFPFYAADIPQRRYDPERAKFHLKKSGYTDPVVFTACDAAFPGALETAQVFQSSAANAGINVKIDRVPNDGYFSKYWAKVPFFGSLWGGKATSDLLLAVEYSGDSPINESHWKNPKFDQLLIASRAETDKAKRQQMYHDMQLLIRDDAATITPIFKATIDGGSKNLRGFVPSPVQQLSNYRAAEMVWFGNA
jgi:peptide/nickel transport system substrate-binding protein